MQNKKNDMLMVVLFFGAVWGILEATLGYVLHLLPTLLSGTVMFPIATFIMIKAYKETGKKSTLLYVGLVAAAIKSIDFLLPGLPVSKTINPMMAIVIESMIVMYVYPMISSENLSKQLGGALAASIGWRAGFVIYMYGLSGITGRLAKWLGTFGKAYTFIVYKGLLSAAIVLAVMLIERAISKERESSFVIKPEFAIFAFVAAIGVTYLV